MITDHWSLPSKCKKIGYIIFYTPHFSVQKESFSVSEVLAKKPQDVKYWSCWQKRLLWTTKRREKCGTMCISENAATFRLKLAQKQDLVSPTIKNLDTNIRIWLWNKTWFHPQFIISSPISKSDWVAWPERINAKLEWLNWNVGDLGISVAIIHFSWKEGLKS